LYTTPMPPPPSFSIILQWEKSPADYILLRFRHIVHILIGTCKTPSTCWLRRGTHCFNVRSRALHHPAQLQQAA
jgi:hypothetical protein